MKNSSLLANHTHKVKIKNILTPLLWLDGICVTTSMGIIYTHGMLFIVYLLLLLPLTFTLLVYTYFMFKDPDRLQSESFILNKSIIENHYSSEQKGELPKLINDEQENLVLDIPKDDRN